VIDFREGFDGYMHDNRSVKLEDTSSGESS